MTSDICSIYSIKLIAESHLYKNILLHRERSEGGDKFVAEPYPLPDRFEVRSTEASYGDYLRNLGVIRQSEQERLQEHYSVARDRRNDIRYKTFIPDYCSEVGDISVSIYNS